MRWYLGRGTAAPQFLLTPQHLVLTRAAVMMPFVLIIVGMCITLATPYIYHSLPEEARGERRRLRYRQKPDRRLERGRGHEGSRDHFGVTQVVEGQTGRHERKDTQHDLSGKDQGQSLSVGQAPNFSEATHKRENKGWVAAAVWSTLAAAGSPAQRRRCLSPPCGEGKHIHTIWSDFGEEMANVQGAVVVRRRGLTNSLSSIAPAHTLDFAATLQSYFTIFNSSLLPSKMFEAGHTPEQIRSLQLERFFGAVGMGDTTAGRYLSSYYQYTSTETPKLARDGYEGVPTVISMPDVFINNLGFFWNAKDYVVPKSCKSDTTNGPSASMDLPPSAKRYEKVAVLAAHWGDGYYHFVVEGLPRIMVVLDVLLEHRDIKIAVHAPAEGAAHRKQYMIQLLELLGIDAERILFLEETIFAELAIVPESVACTKPNAALINTLRTALLQGVYPTTLGVPPLLPRPTIVLIVRETRRGLVNSVEVREALEHNFPTFDVVEFLGHGTVLSQLQTFATASIIVAPHGAGLSNTVVSPLHTPVLEIAPFTCPPCYLNLAVKLQHMYGRHPSGNSFSEQCDTWYEPSADEVVSLVRDLLEAKLLVDAADPPAPKPKPLNSNTIGRFEGAVDIYEMENTVFGH